MDGIAIGGSAEPCIVEKHSGIFSEAPKQGSSKEDDPKTHGLKFDSDKPRWDLIPMEVLLEIMDCFNYLSPIWRSQMEINDVEFLDVTRQVVLNDIYSLIIRDRVGDHYLTRGGVNYKCLAVAAFQCLVLLGKDKIFLNELDLMSKTRWDFINIKDLSEIARIYGLGAKKYAENNWKMVSSERYFAAMMRHLSYSWTNEKYDSELGCQHMHQVIWNMFSMMWLRDNR